MPVTTAHITVTGTGSVSGLNWLADQGAQDPKEAGSEIAMSDGPTPAGSTCKPLYGTSIGVIIFTVVVNKDTGLTDLTTAQVRAIFAGSITNWRQLGGADLPVRIVSRYPDSGSRRTFDQYVLGRPEPQPSSFDCINKNEIPGSRVVLCEEGTTQELLQAVAAVPGAIGYGESSDVDSFTRQGLQPVELNGLQDTMGDIGTGPSQYPFWTVEYLYAYGVPPAGSLAARFLQYMGIYPAKDMLRSNGYTPCVDGPDNLMTTFCAPTAR